MPNILLITSDQHRADSLGVAGHSFVQTPHLDQLAYEGVRFDNAYTDCPVCIPSRTTMITGREAHHNGIPRYAEHERIDRRRDDFLGSLVTAAGYQTALIGKTHWHTEPSFRAADRNGRVAGAHAQRSDTPSRPTGRGNGRRVQRARNDPLPHSC